MTIIIIIIKIIIIIIITITVIIITITVIIIINDVIWQALECADVPEQKNQWVYSEVMEKIWTI